MTRLYTVIRSLNAESADGKTREFKPGETLWCDLNQGGDVFKFEKIGGRFEWFVDRRTFEGRCVLKGTTSEKPS
jgi:hypothetical protein